MEKILLWILLFLSLSKVIPFMPTIPDFIYYGSFLGSFIWMVVRGGLNVSGKYLPFLLAVFFSVWVNEIPAYFRTSSRMIAFFAVVFMVGPFFTNSRLIRFRRILFIRAMITLRWITYLSFFVWLINPALATGTGGFVGITSHSMLIGPLAGLSLLYDLYRFYVNKTDALRYKEIIHGAVTFLALILAGSRSALGATLLAIAFFYARMYKHRTLQMVKVFISVLLLTIITSPLWWSYTGRIRDKMKYSEEKGSLTVTRDQLWMDRLNEFYAFPVFGVGFASINTKYASGNGLSIETGTIEPGNGWLFLLSSMGLIGFISFLIPVGYAICYLYRTETIGLNGSLISSALVFFSIHLQFEGYVVASGAYLCFFLWLLLSESEQLIRNNKLMTI